MDNSDPRLSGAVHSHWTMTLVCRCAMGGLCVVELYLIVQHVLLKVVKCHERRLLLTVEGIGCEVNTAFYLLQRISGLE